MAQEALLILSLSEKLGSCFMTPLMEVIFVAYNLLQIILTLLSLRLADSEFTAFTVAWHYYALA